MAATSKHLVIPKCAICPNAKCQTRFGKFKCLLDDKGRIIKRFSKVQPFCPLPKMGKERHIIITSCNTCFNYRFDRRTKNTYCFKSDEVIINPLQIQDFCQLEDLKSQ